MSRKNVRTGVLTALATRSNASMEMKVRIYNRALSAEEIKLLATATQAGVDVVPAPSADNSGKPDAAERLKKVKSLFDQGLINKEDYDKKVKEIMDSL
jgi:hypothetical protein